MSVGVSRLHSRVRSLGLVVLDLVALTPRFFLLWIISTSAEHRISPHGTFGQRTGLYHETATTPPNHHHPFLFLAQQEEHGRNLSGSGPPPAPSPTAIVSLTTADPKLNKGGYRRDQFISNTAAAKLFHNITQVSNFSSVDHPAGCILYPQRCKPRAKLQSQHCW